MKRFLILIASVVVIGLGAYADTFRAFEPFSKVMVSADAQVCVAQGENFEMIVRSSDGYSEKLIKCVVKDSTLTIVSTDESQNKGKLKILIVSPINPEIVAGRNYDISTKSNGNTDKES